MKNTPFQYAATGNLRILQTTDLHVNLRAYDYFSDQENDAVGLVRTAHLIQAARNETDTCLLFDNGDFLQGNPVGDCAYEQFKNDQLDIHPMVRALNHLKYDAVTLGNHEFNYGVQFLECCLSKADFPAVSSNIITRAAAERINDTTLVAPYILLDRQIRDQNGELHPIRIGAIGFAPPQITIWDRQHVEGKLQTHDIVETARAYVPAMRAAGADIIVALNHSGIGSSQESHRQENAAIPLAGVDGIDVILCGHQHQQFPGPSFKGLPDVDARAGTIKGKPAVMAGFWGSHLGVIDLQLTREEGQWKITDHTVSLRSICEKDEAGQFIHRVPDSPDLLEITAQDHEQTLSQTRQAIGHSTVPFQSYFSLIGDDLSMQVVADAQRWRVAELLADTEWADLPLLSAVAPFKAGGHAGPDYYADVPAGDLSVRNLADLYYFPNQLRAVEINGTQLKNWLERSSGQFNQVHPGYANQFLRNTKFPTYNFDVIYGVTYQIDLSQPSRFAVDGSLLNPTANRITNLCYQGTPVTDTQRFVVATNSYRASGGGGFVDLGMERVILSHPEANRDVLHAYVVENGPLSPEPACVWRFARIPDASVLFDTGPRAFAYLASLKDMNITPVGRAPGGYARFRIDLDSSEHDMVNDADCIEGKVKWG